MGRDTITAGSTASFTLSSCSASNWTASCGTIVAQSAKSVTINLNSSSCSSMVITATGGNAAGTTKTVTVLAAPTFSAGDLKSTSQTISYNSIPSALSFSQASGGLCNGSYSYQWLFSTDSVNFSAIPGANDQNYQPGPLTTTTYFKRQASCPASGIVMTGTVTVTVAPALSRPLLIPANQAINYNTAPIALSVTVAGSSVPHSYQWQSALTPSFTAPTTVIGANSANYTPASPSQTTYYRVVAINNNDSLCSNPAVIVVYPSLNAGILSPATQQIAADSLPELLRCSDVGGGSGEYSYLWYNSLDGNHWNLIPGVLTSGYNPGALGATTWYRVVVSSNGLTATTSSAVINVTPQ